jgi:predicted transcriptional regulator
MEKPEEVFPEANENEEAPTIIKAGDVFGEAGEVSAGAGNIFDSEEELREVLKVTGKAREAKFAKYKEKYAHQKEGLAKMQQAIREKIMDYPEIPEEELFSVIGEFGAQYGFPSGELVSIANAAREYTGKHKVVQEVLGRFATEKNGRPSIDEKELFRTAFFEDPVGEVEVLAAPATIYFRCHNQKDFYQVLKIQAELNGRDAPDFSKLTNEALAVRVKLIKAKIEKCLLAEADGLISAENFGRVVELANEAGGTEQDVRQRVKEETKAIFLHEEQHGVQEIFDNPQGASWASWEAIGAAESQEEKEVLLNRFIREQRMVMDSTAKGEILAYLTGQVNKNNAEGFFKTTKEQLQRGGFYDYYPSHSGSAKKFLLPKLGEENRRLIEASLEKIFGGEYETVVRKGLDALRDLLAGDYSESSRNRARNLLSTVPLRRWPREVGKFLKR